MWVLSWHYSLINFQFCCPSFLSQCPFSPPCCWLQCPCCPFYSSRCPGCADWSRSPKSASGSIAFGGQEELDYKYVATTSSTVKWKVNKLGLEREISTRLGTKMMKMKTPLRRFRIFAIVATTRANLWFYQFFSIYTNLLLIGHRFKWKCEENCVTWSSQDSLRLFQRAQGSKWDQRL